MGKIRDFIGTGYGALAVLFIYYTAVLAIICGVWRTPFNDPENPILHSLQSNRPHQQPAVPRVWRSRTVRFFLPRTH